MPSEREIALEPTRVINNGAIIPFVEPFKRIKGIGAANLSKKANQTDLERVIGITLEEISGAMLIWGGISFSRRYRQKARAQSAHKQGIDAYEDTRITEDLVTQGILDLMEEERVLTETPKIDKLSKEGPLAVLTLDRKLVLASTPVSEPRTECTFFPLEEMQKRGVQRRFTILGRPTVAPTTTEFTGELRTQLLIREYATARDTKTWQTHQISPPVRIFVAPDERAHAILRCTHNAVAAYVDRRYRGIYGTSY